MKGWMRHLALTAVAMGLLCVEAHAGARVVKTYEIFNSSATDTTELASDWFPVFGASRVIIRTWSGKAAFHASTDADSIYSDSITTFKVLLSDSLCCYQAGARQRRFPVGADSIVVDPVTATADTSRTGIIAKMLPINRELRGAANGSGLITVIAPSHLVLSAATAVTSDAGGFIGKQYMRIRVTPLRRNTVTGGNSTQGKRVVGLKALRMVAHVIYNNE